MGIFLCCQERDKDPKESSAPSNQPIPSITFTSEETQLKPSGQLRRKFTMGLQSQASLQSA